MALLSSCPVAGDPTIAVSAVVPDELLGTAKRGNYSGWLISFGDGARVLLEVNQNFAPGSNTPQLW